MGKKPLLKGDQLAAEKLKSNGEHPFPDPDIIGRIT